ncbi:MAG: glycosyltransferase [Actinobacteria bacterium]|nr:glycosyltransferase [Actinomycetota bacterium]
MRPGLRGGSRPPVLGRSVGAPAARRRDPALPSQGRITVTSRRSVALVGTYPPTACGLATFTSNLRAAITAPESGWETRVVRLLDRWEPERSGDVVSQWIAGDGESLSHALSVLNSFDAVLLQHEYGVFGGLDGKDVLALVDGLDVPLLAVLHTALLEPSPHQRQILQRVIEAAAMVVVQSEVARRRILAVHDADPHAVTVIPHGATENISGPVLADVPRPAVLTWGLLSPGKGVEHGIAAVARLRTRCPAASYIVAGQTHPKVRAAIGERYREALQAQVRSLEMEDRVRFDGAYRDWDSLRALVRSADVVLLPYDSRDQVSSGVLVEAVASGRPVVATRFPHAEELLRDGAGFLVDHGDVDAMADALRRTLYEPGLAERMASAARLAAAPLLWPAVGASYRALVDRVLAARAVA